MSKGIEERIIEEISKTGFPLELRVSELLNKSDYYVANNLYYVDLDENKGREIDLRALKNLIFDRYFVRHCLLIECKKSEDKPWVIFSSPITSYDSEYFAVPYAGMDIDRYPPSEFYPFDALESIHPFCKYPRRGRSFFEPFKNKEASETIFKAIMTSVKASSAMRNGSFAAGSESVCFYYPIVVFEGRLFDAYLVDENVQLAETDAIMVSFFYESSKYKNESFTVPVITANHFAEFLVSLDPVLEYWGNLLKKFPQLFTAQPA